MKIVLIVVGSTKEQYLIDGLFRYQKRIKHYIPFEILEISTKQVGNTPKNSLKILEGKNILKKLLPSDHVVALDEKGVTFTSLKFADKIQSWMSRGIRRLIFIIGGPYGFSDDIYARANEKISLSNMTFSHQMVRLFFAEQLYRGYTILNNEPYHNK